jgi:hypothetical protein
VRRHGRDFLLQPAVDRREHELGDIAAQHGDLAHDGAGDELVLVGRGQEQGFDIGQQVAVHARHLEFVFEVGHRAQAAHDHARIVLAHEILEQAGKALDLHVRIVAQHFVGDFQAFVEREEGTLVLAVGDADDQPSNRPDARRTKSS